MSRKYLIALTDLTAFMRRRTLEGERYHISELAKEVDVSEEVVETFLAEALLSSYRDEQLEIFCSMITSTVWPKEMQSATQKINFTVAIPPPKIMAALAHMSLDKTLPMYDCKSGRESMEHYIVKYWISERDGWLAKLDSDLEKSGLAKKMDELYPGRPPLKDALVNRIMEQLGQIPDLTADEVRKFLESRGANVTHI